MRNIYLYIPTVIASFGVITNLINTAVFLHPKMKDPSFKYLLVISISDLIYLAMSLGAFNYLCEKCLVRQSYFEILYFFTCVEFIIRVLAIFSILTELFLSIQRYMALKNKRYIKEKMHKWLIFGLFLASLIYYMPLTLFRQIIPFEYSNQTTNATKINIQDNLREYNLEYNELGSTKAGIVIPIVLQMIRFFLGSIVNSALNLVITYEFRKRYAKKRKTDTIEMCKCSWI
jgi:hypothetical protein